MDRWTRAQVEKFAPDDKSVKAATKLARPGPWSETGSTDTLVWGKCQGSGKTPYQVSVDLTGPAVKCTCPSRKFPCKHGIALLMLWVDGDGSIAETAEASGFAADWAEDRAARSSSAQAKADRGAQPSDPEAAAKRLEKRLTLMTAGAADFEIWLADLYRKGFAAARQQPYSFWEAPAARLLDSQLPGLAQRVRDVPASLYGDDWADVLLIETGRWFTAVTAWQRRDELADEDLANLRVFLGWPVAVETVRTAEAVSDTWMVRGLHRTDDGRLKSQRTWLQGATTGIEAVLLDFAAGGAFLDAGHVVGSRVVGDLARYPGSGVRRGVFVEEPSPAPSGIGLSDATSIAETMDRIAQLIATNPFADDHPACLEASIAVTDSGPVVTDRDGSSMNLVSDYEPWTLLALAGDATASMFGEVSSGRFRPLTLATDTGLVPV